MKSRFKIDYIFILAMALTALDFVVAVLTSEMSYLTNDDGGIQSVLSGTATGEPYPFHQFINVLLSYPLAGLYRIFPGIQWWYVWSMTVVAVGIFLVHYFLLKMAAKNKHSILVALGILIFIDLGFFIYPIANISFTIVPAILGTGIVAGWFYLAEAKEVKREKLFYVLTIIGYVLSFCHRRQTGIVLLCFLLLAFLYYFITRSESRKKAAVRFLVTAAIFIAISGALTVINRTVQNNHNGEAFVEFNSARSRFMDYPHDTYEENPELYAEVGWDWDTYCLASHWCFIPDDVDAESLSYISEQSSYTSEDMATLLQTIWQDGLCRSILLLFFASLIMAGFLVVIRFNRKTFIFLLLNNLGTVGLFFYQILTGRAMYRSMIVFLLPAVVINVMLCFRRKLRKQTLRNTFYLVVLVLGIICAAPILTATFNNEHNESVANKKITLETMDQYLTEHPDNFYVLQTGVTDNIYPGRKNRKVSNTIAWGGSTYHSAQYYKVLGDNGLSELTGETFKNENVYLVCKANVMNESDDAADTDKDLFKTFYRYLKNNYGAIGFVQEDMITKDAYVYHFVFEENAAEYKEYYDLVDGHVVLME